MAAVDLTGHCARGNHDKCTGALLSGTGHHWWCTCDCHDDPPAPRTDDERTAYTIWQGGRQ